MSLTTEVVYTHVSSDLLTGQVRVRSKTVAKDEKGVVQFEKDNPEILDDATGVHATAALGATTAALALKVKEAEDNQAAAEKAKADVDAALTEEQRAHAETKALVAALETEKVSLTDANASLGEQRQEAVAALAVEQEAHAETRASLEAAAPSV